MKLLPLHEMPKNNSTVEKKRNFKGSRDRATHLSGRPLSIVGNLTSITDKFRKNSLGASNNKRAIF